MRNINKRLKKKRIYRLTVNRIGCLFPGLVKRPAIIDDREKLEEYSPFIIPWPEDAEKPFVGLVQDTDADPYWTKFERFLKNNRIPFSYYNIHASSWREEARKFDLIIWRPMSRPMELEEARRKVYVLEKYLHKKCLPTLDTIMIYEDKILQYELLTEQGFPCVETFISHDWAEIEETIQNSAYPIVSKFSPSSGSFDVELVTNSRQAMDVAQKAFSFPGRKTYWPYLSQKDYVYFQKFQKNEGYDLRIIIAGDILMGFYRYVPTGDFRASGMGLFRWDELPADAIKIARDIAQKFNFIAIAVDMLRDPDTKELLIIEMSSFSGIDGDECAKDGQFGIYLLQEDGSYLFKPGYFWLQDFIMKELLEREWLSVRGFQRVNTRDIIK